MKNLYRKFLVYYSQSTQREKLILLTGVICIIIILFYSIISPFFSRLKRLDERITEKRNELLEVIELQSRYGDTAQDTEGSVLERDVSLLSVIESITSKLNITVQSFRPQEADSSPGLKELTAEVKISNITLKELTDFLYFLEKDSRYSIWIKKFHAKVTFKDPNRLDVDLVMGALQSK